MSIQIFFSNKTRKNKLNKINDKMSIRNLLVGIDHSNKSLNLEDPLEVVSERISHLESPSVGLELPEDYSDRERHGIKYGLFGDIASSLRGSHAVPFPLESPEIWDEYGLIDATIRLFYWIRHGNTTREDVEKYLQDTTRELRDDSISDDDVYKFRKDLQKWDKAYEMLKTLTLSELINSWENAVQKRESYVLGKIESHQPEIVVIGHYHADRLNPKLPGYEYSRLAFPFIVDRFMDWFIKEYRNNPYGNLLQ